MVANCRIGRIKLKAGGEVYNLPNKQHQGHKATIINHAREIAGQYDALDGFFIIGWDKDGHYSVGCRYDSNGSISTRLFPSWLEEVARDEVITHDTACGVVNRALGND